LKSSCCEALDSWAGVILPPRLYTSKHGFGTGVIGQSGSTPHRLNPKASRLHTHQKQRQCVLYIFSQSPCSADKELLNLMVNLPTAVNDAHSQSMQNNRPSTIHHPSGSLLGTVQYPRSFRFSGHASVLPVAREKPLLMNHADDFKSQRRSSMSRHYER
jgi:hypothetical protein